MRRKETFTAQMKREQHIIKIFQEINGESGKIMIFLLTVLSELKIARSYYVIMWKILDNEKRIWIK